MKKDTGIFKVTEAGGIFELNKAERCLDPSHNFPSHMCIPQGHGYRHVCPKCGAVKIVKNPIAFNT